MSNSEDKIVVEPIPIQQKQAEQMCRTEAPMPENYQKLLIAVGKFKTGVAELYSNLPQQILAALQSLLRTKMTKLVSKFRVDYNYAKFQHLP